jgi:hypothetical protein
MRIAAVEYVSADGRMQMEDPEGREDERGAGPRLIGTTS